MKWRRMCGWEDVEGQLERGPVMEKVLRREAMLGQSARAKGRSSIRPSFRLDSAPVFAGNPRVLCRVA